MLDQVFDYVTVQAIVEHGNLNIAFALPLLHSLGFPTSGVWLGIAVPGNVSTYYSYYGVLQPLLSVPFYCLGILLHMPPWVAIALFYTPTISAISVCLVFSIARRLRSSVTHSLVLSFMYGLTSILWPFSKFYFDVSTAAVTLLAAAYFLFDPHPSVKSDFLCGLFAVLSVFAKTVQVIMLPAIVVYLIYRRSGKRIVSLSAFLAPVAVGSVLFGYMNLVMWGSPFASGYGLSSNPFSSMYFTSVFQILVAIYGLLFSSGVGLFVFCPLCAIGAFVLLAYDWDRGQRFVLAWFFFANLFYYARYVGWTGGGWGPRYLLVSMPFLILALGPFLRTAEGSIVRTLTLCVASAWGFIMNFLGVLLSIEYVKLYLCTLLPYCTLVGYIKGKVDTSPIYWDPSFSPLRGAWALLWAPDSQILKLYPKGLSMLFLNSRLDLLFYSHFGLPAMVIFFLLIFAEVFWLYNAIRYSQLLHPLEPKRHRGLSSSER